MARRKTVGRPAIRDITRPKRISPEPEPRPEPVQEAPPEVHVCEYCGVSPCLADSERNRIQGKQVVDITSGLSYVVNDVGHLRHDIDVYAKVKGHERPIVTSRLR